MDWAFDFPFQHIEIVPDMCDLHYTAHRPFSSEWLRIALHALIIHPIYLIWIAKLYPETLFWILKDIWSLNPAISK